MSAEIVNKTTGECLLTDKGGREYRLLFDLSAVAALETMCGAPVMEILDRRPGILDLTRMLVAGSQGYGRRNRNGDQRISASLAMKVLGDCGGLELTGPLVRSLCLAEGLGFFTEADVEGDAEGGDGDDPPGGPGPAL